MTEDLRAWENLYHLLEVISEELVKMGLYWRLEDSRIDTLADPKWPKLNWQMKYADHFLYNCKLTEEGLSPLNSKLECPFITWKYALLVDCGIAEGMITRKHPDDSFNTVMAFDNIYYLGWCVKFFDTMKQVEQYVNDTKFDRYILYKGFEKTKTDWQVKKIEDVHV